MKKNQKFLTTVFVFIMLLLGSSEALGGVVTTGADGDAFSAGDWGGPGIPPSNNSTIDMQHDITADVDGRIIDGIRVNAIGKTLTVDDSFDLGSVGGPHPMNIYFNNPAIKLTLTGTAGDGDDPAVDTYNQLGEIDFNGLPATLNINAASGDLIFLESTFVNTQNATLSADYVGVFDPSVTKFAKINIANKLIFYDMDVDINPTAEDQIVFTHDNSILELQAITDNRTFTLQNDINPGDNKGVLILTAEPGYQTILDGNGLKKLGKGNNLKELRINGDGFSILTSNIDASGIDALNIQAFARLFDDSGTTATIPKITIGGATGLGSLIFYDANVNINPIADNQIVFAHDNSTLELQAITNNRTFTLQNDINPGDNKGILSLHTENNKNLILDGSGLKKLGKDNNLKELYIVGNGYSVLTPNIDASGIDTLIVRPGAFLFDKRGTTADIHNIILGDATGSGTLIFDNANVNINPHGDNQIVFAHDNSILELQAITNNRTFTLQNDINPGDNKGILSLYTENNKNLILDGGGLRKLGKDYNLKELRINGNGYSILTPNIDASGIDTLTVRPGAFLFDKRGTTADIHNIILGDATGSGTLIFDNADVNINPHGDNQIVFAHDNSTLELQARTDNRTFTLQNDINPGDNKGILSLHTENNKNLILDGSGLKKLGKDNNLKELYIVGNGYSVLTPNIDASGIDTLTVRPGAFLFDKRGTTADIRNIILGGATGSGMLVFDYADVNINPHGDNQIVFAHNDSILNLQSNSGNTRTFTLKNNIDTPDNKGIARLFTSRGGGSKIILTGDGGIKRLGGNGGNLKLLEAQSTGGGSITIKGDAGGGVDLSNIDRLDVYEGTTLISETATVGAFLRSTSVG